MQPADEEFFFTVYASTRTEELSVVPWTAEQKEAFLRMQSHAQLTDYHQNYPQAKYQIIEQGAKPVGRMIVDDSGDPIILMDIALLPEYRNAGIGTALIRELMARAEKMKRALRLHVETFNPAMRLYTRLGFVKSGEISMYHEMTWTPQAR